jgi:hypothetical protein
MEGLYGKAVMVLSFSHKEISRQTAERRWFSPAGRSGQLILHFLMGSQSLVGAPPTVPMNKCTIVPWGVSPDGLAMAETPENTWIEKGYSIYGAITPPLPCLINNSDRMCRRRQAYPG